MLWSLKAHDSTLNSCRAHQLCLGTTSAAVRSSALKALAGLAPRFCEPEQAAAMVATMAQVRPLIGSPGECLGDGSWIP